MFEVGLTSILVPSVFAFLFLTCEFGGRVATQFDSLDQEVERCNWYALPIELQRIYLIFSLDVQQPKEIQSYAGLVCSRETFKHVIDNTTV